MVAVGSGIPIWFCGLYILLSSITPSYGQDCTLSWSYASACLSPWSQCFECLPCWNDGESYIESRTGWIRECSSSTKCFVCQQECLKNVRNSNCPQAKSIQSRVQAQPRVVLDQSLPVKSFVLNCSETASIFTLWGLYHKSEFKPWIRLNATTCDKDMAGEVAAKCNGARRCNLTVEFDRSHPECQGHAYEVSFGYYCADLAKSKSVNLIVTPSSPTQGSSVPEWAAYLLIICLGYIPVWYCCFGLSWKYRARIRKRAHRCRKSCCNKFSSLPKSSDLSKTDKLPNRKDFGSRDVYSRRSMPYHSQVDVSTVKQASSSQLSRPEGQTYDYTAPHHLNYPYTVSRELEDVPSGIAVVFDAQPREDAQYVDGGVYAPDSGLVHNSKVPYFGQDQNEESAQLLDELGGKIVQMEQVELNVMQEIGRGSFGRVYRARFRNQIVAAKKFRRSDVDEQRVQEFIKHEIELASQASGHENVLLVYGYCLDPFILVTECMDISVRKYMDTKKERIPLSERVDIALQAANGVAHLHRIQIIHRDIAARNLLMSWKDGVVRVVVSDFGMSKIMTQESYAQTYSAVGPLKWMAPESIKEQKFSTSSDVYAFGITLWEIFTGEMPYADIDAVNTAVLVLVRGRRPELYPTIPRGLCDIMQHCWQNDHSDRPEIENVIERLEQFKEEL